MKRRRVIAHDTEMRSAGAVLSAPVQQVEHDLFAIPSTSIGFLSDDIEKSQETVLEDPQAAGDDPAVQLHRRVAGTRDDAPQHPAGYLPLAIIGLTQPALGR